MRQHHRTDERTRTDEGEDKLDEIRESEDRYRKIYRDPDRELKTMARKDKKDYIENLAEKEEEAEARQDLKALHTFGKTLRGGYSNRRAEFYIE